MADVAVEMINRQPSRVVRTSFSILTFDGQGFLSRMFFECRSIITMIADLGQKNAKKKTSKPSDGAAASFPTRILLVDDHDIVREGLMALLSRTVGMTVVGTAVTGEDAVLAARRLSPDVIVMDLVLPILNGLDATRRILSEWPLTHIVALSGCHTSEHVHRALRAGARGYVTKTSAGSDLVAAVKAVIAGNRYISAGIMPVTLEALGGRSGSTRSCGHLSEREFMVLRLLVAGLSSTRIARQLSVSPKSVDTYRHRLMVKLGVANRAELIRVAVEYELISV
jgi:DNA-binding NarL/FixJ family response regulator